MHDMSTTDDDDAAETGDLIQEEVRAEIRNLERFTGMSLSAIADAAGVSASTLTRFMNKKKVKHVPGNRTMAKIRAAFPGFASGTRDNPAILAGVSERMRQARQALAPNTDDDTIAAIVGWGLEEMTAVLTGTRAPSLTTLRAFALRVNVTADFLLYGKLEGLPRASEIRLLAMFPGLASGPEGTD